LFSVLSRFVSQLSSPVAHPLLFLRRALNWQLLCLGRFS